MRVVVPPVIVDDRICRIVSPVESLLEVEEWVGAWWEPSAVPLTIASLAPRASERVLLESGVPEADRMHGAVRPTSEEIEAILLTRDPERSAQMRFDEQVQRGTGPRRRKYPGNARFRRDARGGTGTEADRRHDAPREWTGPWRRATDPPPPEPAA
jgi:hypothetical protein